MSELDKLVDIIAQLRSENGCPWDRVQTHDSLKLSLIEESYEVIQAIDNKDTQNLKEELGDLLMQVIFHAQIKKEESAFDITDVIEGICNKMIARHPHVFQPEEAGRLLKTATEEDVTDNWEALKRKEKNSLSYTQELRDVPVHLPALLRAAKIFKKAAKTPFTNESLEDCLDKASASLDSIAAQVPSSANHMDQIGNLLLSVIKISCFLHINPEFALTNAIETFINRFEHVEKADLTSNLKDLESSRR